MTIIKTPSTPLADLLADDVNLNDQGYRVFADEVLKTFDEYFATSYELKGVNRQRTRIRCEFSILWYRFYNERLNRYCLSKLT